MRIRFALLVVCLVQAAVVTVAILRSTAEDWRRHQLAYFEVAMGRASGPAARAALEKSGLEVRQDMLTGFGDVTRVDRCRTCHAAIDDPRFSEGSHPLRAHPPIPGHSLTEFGCTICHEGNGRALVAADAHGADPFWPEPLMRAPFIEASCARCHPSPYLAEMPHIRRGRELFSSYACVGCHTLRGLARGKLGPDLTDEGSRRKLDFIRQSILEPKADAPSSLMPKFTMPAEDVTDLVIFLKSQRGRTLVDDPITLRVQTQRWREEKPLDVAVSLEAGRDAVRNRSCTACHKLGEKDGKLAPDLTFAGRLRDAPYIAAHLLDPRAHTGGSNMPTFWMSASERDAIAAYLVSLTQVAVPAAPAEQYKLLCARCHGTEGRGNGPIADNLLPMPRDFGNAKYFRWLPESRSRRAILEGVPGTAMPPFGKLLNEEQAGALFDYVRKTFVKPGPEKAPAPRRLPAANARPYTAASVAAGKAVFALRCYGCHGRLGNGKGPNALDLVPRPRDLTSTPFLARADDLRLFESLTYGVVGTGMPPWDYLPETERWDLVNFVRSLSKTGPAAARTDRTTGGPNG